MSTPLRRPLTRRAWLARNARAAALVPLAQPGMALVTPLARRAAPLTLSAALRDPVPWEALARRAVEAATAAGAIYADARLTRTVSHKYNMAAADERGSLFWEIEELGVGVRALVHGCWGFAASPYATPEGVVQLAQDAVGQATKNTRKVLRPVELGSLPVVTGHWATPVTIDPFTVPIEEKLDDIRYWNNCIRANGYKLYGNGYGWLRLQRQERVLATSTGSLVTQTLYETEAAIAIDYGKGTLGGGGDTSYAPLTHLDAAGRGWDLIMDAKIPEQIPVRVLEAKRRDQIPKKPVTLGRYTLVLDGRTMANLLNQTLGVATQLDRALGYEANAAGTSFVDDPLTMVGQALITAPLVTVTANRSAATELATVRWDDEGVVPDAYPLIKDGVLVDFQTTREQAAWLAPYYERHGQPVKSHGCAAAQDALYSPLQMMPNLALQPSTSSIGLEDLVHGVADGILITNGGVAEMDFQARNGLVVGEMRQIKNGRLGDMLLGGVVRFNTIDLWRHLQALGGPSTEVVLSAAQDPVDLNTPTPYKGEPAQATSHSVRAVAAVVPNQPVTTLSRG